MQTPWWWARLSDLLPPNPGTYACFLAGHTRLSNQSWSHANFLGVMPRQHFVTHLQSLPKASNDNDSQKVPEPQIMEAGENTLGSCRYIPALSATLPLKPTAGTVWDKILCWTDLWSGLSQPFSSHNTLVTAWYIPCLLNHCDKDFSNTSNCKAVNFKRHFKPGKCSS